MRFQIINKFLLIVITAAVVMAVPGFSYGENQNRAYTILKKHIIDFNQAALENARQGDSYRGEQGILRIRPDIAESFGMKVVVDQDYLESKRLFEEAEEALENARKAMAFRGSERSSGKQAEKTLEYLLLYREKDALARIKLANHLSGLITEPDDRFNEKISKTLMEQMLAESFQKTDNRLRDGLAYFYNLSQGITNSRFPLTTVNVRFVNHVFNGFIEDADESVQNLFYLDRDKQYYSPEKPGEWKEVIKKDLAELIPIIESEIAKTGKHLYRVDPLLFVALLRRESAFNPLAVSSVGAAGLAQIMPLTAKDLGLKNIYMPDYFTEATGFLRQERELRIAARASLMKIEKKSDLNHARRAYEMMQESLDLGQQRQQLFNRYRNELTETKSDGRLDPSNAIEFGLKYFAELLKRQNGDISLALSSYNAGPHRVTQYNGIPPFDETVGFRNWVMQFYTDYLNRVDR